jgi:peroxiredoxin
VSAWLIAALVVPWVLVALLLFLMYVLVKHHGELLYRQQMVEREPAEPPEPSFGLAVGTEAPDVVLRDVAGHERRIGEFFGEPFVLAFFSADCGYCKELAPQLAELPAGSPRLVLISSGDPAELRLLAAAHDWRFDVLVESDDWRSFQAYEQVGTPSAYTVAGDGRIARQLAVGAEPVLRLLASPPPRGRSRPPSPTPSSA